MGKFKKVNYEWRENLSTEEWDRNLAMLHGHPLQSAKWGKSKKSSDGISDHRWIAYKNSSPVFMARVEERILFRFLKIAWCPKGPLIIHEEDESNLYKEFLKRLKMKGFFMCATNPWKKLNLVRSLHSAFYTIWLDLTLKKEKLWENLHKKCRSDIRRSKKLGVVIDKSSSMDDVKSFYSICTSISQSKGFNLCTSVKLMKGLLFSNDLDHVESVLFIAKFGDYICGGAFVIRCGECVHYIWGAINREFSHLCVGEALQWEVIEWAISKACTKYDLEGISPNQDSGVDKFKKRLGGTVIAYPKIRIYSLQFLSYLLFPFAQIYLVLHAKLTPLKFHK